MSKEVNIMAVALAKAQAYQNTEASESENCVAEITATGDIINIAFKIAPENIKSTKPKLDENNKPKKGTGGKPFITATWQGTPAFKAGSCQVYLTEALLSAMSASR